MTKENKKENESIYITNVMYALSHPISFHCGWLWVDGLAGDGIGEWQSTGNSESRGKKLRTRYQAQL